MNIDPLADKLSNTYYTPYHYCSNDPINRIDPDGKDDWKLTKDNKLVKIKETNDSFHRIYKINNEGKNVPFYRTDNKLVNGLEDNGWNRIKNLQNRKSFTAILDSSKNKEALENMRERARKEGFLDSFDILISSTQSLNVSPTDRGDPDRYSVGYDLLNGILDLFEMKKEEKVKEKENEKKKSEGAKKLLKDASSGNLEEGKYIWYDSSWIKE